MKKFRVFYTIISNFFYVFIGLLGHFAHACIKGVRLKKDMHRKGMLCINKNFIKNTLFTLKILKI